MSQRPVVVLAEDDALLREMVAEAIEQEGYRVVACDNGFGALKAFFTEPRVDVLVLDWLLPDIEGQDLIRMLHAQRGLSELPVVLTTGLERELPVFEGAVCLLRKPFAADELSRILHRLTQSTPPVAYAARSPAPF
ncbi:response regulator [Myxococcus landrumensis]|uniref:Response regulator n=1 Tax=Myxococcus landrumensis TaxID=2813577 RepID=A0ABX7MXM4_9BACT|nr:response regulator [Myxococcus landrumus]QSQ11187.1 response regulator [Myxococcus landrumus]